MANRWQCFQEPEIPRIWFSVKLHSQAPLWPLEKRRRSRGMAARRQFSPDV